MMVKSSEPTNKFVEFLKSQKKYVRCVVCGHGLSSEYDSEINAYPVFHKPSKAFPFCELNFFTSLTRIYQYIHEEDESVSISVLVKDFNWIEPVQLKKEMITWCLGRGYLALDSLKRIEVPEAISEACRELFQTRQLQTFDGRAQAVEVLSAAFKCLQSELVPVEQKDMPLKYDTPDMGALTDAERERIHQEFGMFTAERTGADEYGKRESLVERILDER